MIFGLRFKHISKITKNATTFGSAVVAAKSFVNDLSYYAEQFTPKPENQEIVVKILLAKSPMESIFVDWSFLKKQVNMSEHGL